MSDNDRPYFPTNSCPIVLLGAIADIVLIVGALVLGISWLLG